MRQLVCLSLSVVFLVVQLAILSDAVGPHKNQKLSKKDYKVKEKDLKNAKARWIQVHDDEEWGDDMMQHPIDEPPRRRNRELGEICTYSRDCSSGCCLLDRDTKVRSCQTKAIFGEKCSAAQVKADLYVDACPCQSGENYCSFPDEVCKK